MAASVLRRRGAGGGNNTLVGIVLGSTAIGIYLFTMHHLKAQAPGNLDEMVVLK